MEIVDHKYFPKKQNDATHETLHVPEDSTRKAKKEYKVIESTFTNALRSIGITEWPFIRKTTNKASCASKTRINPTVSGASSLGSLKADDLPSCLVKVEASEGSLERTTITNTSALETQNDQIVSCNTNYTEVLSESEYARPNFLPGGNRFECQDHETTFLDDLNLFVVDNDYDCLGQEIPDWSKSRTDQTLCDETSSIGILNNAGDLNSGWDIDLDDIDLDHVLDHLLDQEIHDLSETHTDQTLCDGTNSFGILNDAGCDFNSSWDKGVNERPSELFTTTNTSASGVHQSPITSFEQEPCEMGDDFFSPDMFKDF